MAEFRGITNALASSEAAAPRENSSRNPGCGSTGDESAGSPKGQGADVRSLYDTRLNPPQVGDDTAGGTEEKPRRKVPKLKTKTTLRSGPKPGDDKGPQASP